MKEVVRKEILKLLEAGIIYPVVDSQWVSLVHCVPKKGGITVIPNDKDELIPAVLVFNCSCFLLILLFSVVDSDLISITTRCKCDLS